MPPQRFISPPLPGLAEAKFNSFSNHENRDVINMDLHEGWFEALVVEHGIRCRFPLR